MRASVAWLLLLAARDKRQLPWGNTNLIGPLYLNPAPSHGDRRWMLSVQGDQQAAYQPSGNGISGQGVIASVLPSV